jgi:hypothetical protein
MARIQGVPGTPSSLAAKFAMDSDAAPPGRNKNRHHQSVTTVIPKPCGESKQAASEDAA